MKNKKFDQELKSEVENFHSSADPTAIWAAIETEVEQINEEAEEKERKPLVWIFNFLLVGILAGTIILELWDFVGAETAIIPLSNTEVDVRMPKPVTKYIETSLNPDKPKTETNTTTETLRAPQKKEAKIIHQHKKSPSGKMDLETQFTISVIPDSAPMTNLEVKNSADELYFNQLNEETVDILTFTNSEKAVSQSALIKQKDISDNATTYLLALTNQMTQLSDPSTDISKMMPPPLSPIFSSTERRRRRTPPWSIGFEIQTGVALTNRDLSLRHAESQSWLDLREATESTLETVQIGGLIELQHRSGFAISTGIQWSRIAEKYTVDEITTTENLENTLISFSIDMNQDTVNEMYSDIIRTSTTTTTREGFNNYRLLDIPLLFGYHIKNETWSLGFQTGILTNLNLSTKGFIYDENSQLIDLAANQQATYKSSIGIGFYAGLTGSVALTDNLQITASPFYRKNTGSFTLSDGSISQKYSWLGMNVGFRIRM